MTLPLRALIVDDEPPARQALMQLLREMRHVEIAATASNGIEALDALAGMDLAMRLYPAITPVLVFVTAWPRYATGAFDVGAADYLLKPVDPQRLALAIERARQQLQAHDDEQRIAALESSMQQLRARQGTSDLDHVWVELPRGRQRVDLNKIEWFAADGDYVQAHVAGRSYLMRDSLNRLEATLPPDCFVRVHRATIVNITAVTRIVTANNGQLRLSTRSGAELGVGRRTRSRVSRLLGG